MKQKIKETLWFILIFLILVVVIFLLSNYFFPTEYKKYHFPEVIAIDLNNNVWDYEEIKDKKFEIPIAYYVIQGVRMPEEQIPEGYPRILGIPIDFWGKEK